MNINTQTNRIKLGLFVSYLIALFIPVYSITFNNQVFKSSVSKLNAGTFFVILFLVLIIVNIVIYLIKNEYYKYVYYLLMLSMLLLLSMLVFLKEPNYSLRLGFYLQSIIVFFIISIYFFESWTLKFYNKIKQSLIHLFNLIKSKLSKDKELLDEVGNNEKN